MRKYFRVDLFVLMFEYIYKYLDIYGIFFFIWSLIFVVFFFVVLGWRIFGWEVSIILEVVDMVECVRMYMCMRFCV